MKEQKKKKLIVILLFISCLISGYILFNTSNADSKRLQSVAQVDSLIQTQLVDFNINDDQLTVQTIRVDSNFVRKKYRIAVPYHFSKTQFHAELNQLLHPYNIQTPAQVSFPAQDVNIQLTYHHTVIRTILLQTDPKLSMQPNNIHILVTFDELPNDQMLTALASLGDNIPLVFKIEQPMEVQDLKEELNRRYEPIIFWLQNQNGKDLIKTNPDAATARLSRLQDLVPNTNILLLQDIEQTTNLESFSELNFINARNALLLHEELGKTSFFKELEKLQANTKLVTALISGNQTTVSWLKEKLPDLKRSGTNIINPVKLNL